MLIRSAHRAVLRAEKEDVSFGLTSIWVLPMLLSKWRVGPMVADQRQYGVWAFGQLEPSIMSAPEKSSSASCRNKKRRNRPFSNLLFLPTLYHLAPPLPHRHELPLPIFPNNLIFLNISPPKLLLTLPVSHCPPPPVSPRPLHHKHCYSNPRGFKSLGFR